MGIGHRNLGFGRIGRAGFGSAAMIALTAAAAAQPANDFCADAAAIGGFGVYSFDTAGGTTDGPPNGLCMAFSSDQIQNDVWYCWTAAESGATRVTTCGQTTLDTRIAVYDGCGCPEGFNILACGDDSCGLQTTVEFVAVAGQSYLLRIGSFGALQFGSGTFEVLSANVPVLHGPVVNPANGHTYYLLESSSWTAAQSGAEALGGDLATVDDGDENEFLRALVLGFDGADRRGWIGFTDRASEGNFSWISGAATSYVNWNGGEPNNSGGNEHYAEMFGSNGLWNDNQDAPTAVVVFGLVEVVASNPCPGDVNGDERVDLADLAVLLSNFGGSGGLAQGDIDGDGDVDLADLATLLANFGTIC